MKKLLCLITASLLINFIVYAQSDYTEPSTGIVFPPELAGFKMGKVTDFEKDQKGLGVSIGYRHQTVSTIWADIYIYNLSINNIVGGHDSKETHSCYDEAESQIYGAQKKGIYKKVKKVSKEVIPFSESENNKKIIKGVYTFKANGKKLISNLLVTGYKNNFFKIRFSYPQEYQSEGEEALKTLIKELNMLLE